MGNDGVCRVGELGETFPNLNQLWFPYTPYPSSNWVKPLNNKIEFIYFYFFYTFPLEILFAMGETGGGWLHPGLRGGGIWTTKGVWRILGENRTADGVPCAVW